MKRKFKFLALIALIAFAGLGFACGGGDSGDSHTHNWNTETGLCSGCSDLYYAIGDTGPGSGKIFYVSAGGFPMTGIGTCHYLEASPAGTDEILAWAEPPNHNDDVPGLGTAIGTGKNNTIVITTQLDLAHAPAAWTCKNATYGGKTDWFFPSKDELNELCINKDIVILKSDYFYWSSSKIGGLAWYQYSDTGDQDNDVEGNNVRNVRAIRAF